MLRRLTGTLGIAIITALLVILASGQTSSVLASFSNSLIKTTDYSKDLVSFSPAPSSASSKPHPLPPALTQWQDNTNSGDYFSQVKPTQVGYLVWSQFPVKVYIKSPSSVNSQQDQAWVSAILQAVQEWNVYLPLEVVEDPDQADITIIRKAPPLRTSSDYKIIRARSAQTTYELYSNKNNLLSHRFTILLSPSQIGYYLTAAARHEIGHALGIWGHSPLQSDALYFSQVRNPPPISVRDVNTLKRVYEQATSLGWSAEGK